MDWWKKWDGDRDLPGDIDPDDHVVVEMRGVIAPTLGRARDFVWRHAGSGLLTAGADIVRYRLWRTESCG